MSQPQQVQAGARLEGELTQSARSVSGLVPDSNQGSHNA